MWGERMGAPRTVFQARRLPVCNGRESSNCSEFSNCSSKCNHREQIIIYIDINSNFEILFICANQNLLNARHMLSFFFLQNT